MFVDPRVKDWFLMDSCAPTFVMTACYIFIVRIGPWIMRDKKPLNFPRVLFLYNMFLVAVNFHIFYEVSLSTSTYDVL